MKSARILAREVVRANKQRDRLVSSKARLGSVQMQLQHQLCEFHPCFLCVSHPSPSLTPSFARLTPSLLGSLTINHGRFRASLSPKSLSLTSLSGTLTDVCHTAMVKVTGAFQKSSEIMKTTNQLVKLPQLSATMREMSMEMMKVCLEPFSFLTSLADQDSLG